MRPAGEHSPGSASHLACEHLKAVQACLVHHVRAREQRARLLRPACVRVRSRDPARATATHPASMRQMGHSSGERCIAFAITDAQSKAPVRGAAAAAAAAEARPLPSPPPPPRPSSIMAKTWRLIARPRSSSANRASRASSRCATASEMRVETRAMLEGRTAQGWHQRGQRGGGEEGKEGAAPVCKERSLSRHIAAPRRVVLRGSGSGQGSPHAQPRGAPLAPMAAPPLAGRGTACV